MLSPSLWILVIKLKSDYFRIEISIRWEYLHERRVLKSDYFRIEIQLRKDFLNDLTELKSDYFRIEIHPHTS